MNLPRIQSIIAPMATPAAPAVLLVNEIYRTMVAVDIAPIIAMGSAIIALIGVEFSGALMCFNAVRAWQRKSIGIMWIAIMGAVVYATIVIIGVASMPEQRGRVFGIMVLLTLVAYAGYAIFMAFETEDSKRTKTAQIDLARLDKERLLTNAQTRQIKAGGLSNRPIGQIERQSNTIEQPQTITTAGQHIIDYLNTNGDGASLREIARACNVKSPSTVKTWIEYWKSNVGTRVPKS